jgi:hypothetical protein
MIQHLIQNDLDPKEMANLARSRLRSKLSELEMALEGILTDHHRMLFQLSLQMISPFEEGLSPGPISPIGLQRERKRATLALAHTLLIMAYHIIKEQCTYKEFGADYFDRLNEQYLIKRLTSRIRNVRVSCNVGKRATDSIIDTTFTC